MTICSMFNSGSSLLATFSYLKLLSTPRFSGPKCPRAPHALLNQGVIVCLLAVLLIYLMELRSSIQLLVHLLALDRRRMRAWRKSAQEKRFIELSSTLEPDRPATTDKLAILGDAIRVLNQLKSESQEFKEMKEKLSEEIKTLKAEKNELREEKLVLKAEKAKMEQQVKSMTNNLPPPGYMAPYPAAFQAGVNKLPVFPGYGYIPMWQYLPQSTCDTSHDHELRPPAA